MKKLKLCIMFALVAFSLTFFEGCTQGGSPKGAVKDFLSAVRAKDALKIEKSLDLERLLTEKTGGEYLKMPPDERARQLEIFRKSIVNGFISGNLRHFGEIDPMIEKETVIDNKAEVTVTDKKDRKKTFLFSLEKEGGAWRLYRIESR